MHSRWLWLAPTIAVATAAAPACSGSPTASLDGAYTPVDSSAGGSTGKGGAGAAASGLPCDLAMLLQSRCDSCHGSTPSQGAPTSLVTWADLEAPSVSDPTKKNAEVALARMQSAKQPMPPKPAAPATPAEIAILQSWIAGGSLHGTCGGGAAGSSGAAGTTAVGGAGGAPAQMGLPCDVAAVVASKCLSCHGSPVAGGAPMSLVTYADLVAPSLSDPTKSFAQVSAARMTDTVSPMPPKSANAASAMDIQVFQAWVQSGAPMGACGTGAGGGPTAPPPEACSSTSKGTTGESATMNPGQPCMSCHVPGGEAAEKAFAFGGTVYPKGHNMMNQCNGINGQTGSLAGASVVVTDSNGKVFKVSVGPNGNFYRYATSTFVPPYSAELAMADGTTNKMGTMQTSGDCNSCHTDTGANGAPGRIWTPLAHSRDTTRFAARSTPCSEERRGGVGVQIVLRGGIDVRDRAFDGLCLRQRQQSLIRDGGFTKPGPPRRAASRSRRLATRARARAPCPR